MYRNVKPVFFKAMSGIHAGTGSDLGLVDLPIQRERHSGLPKIESSGVKGCIREEFEHMGGLPEDFVKLAFGPDDEDEKSKKNTHAGSIAFTDARLLLFPVRSARGVFAYATCPYILKRLAGDFSLINGFAFDGLDLMSIDVTETAQVSSGKLIINNSGKAVLEEYTIPSEETDNAKKLAGNIAAWLNCEDDKYIRDNLIILSDDDFKDFTRNNTEIITRIKIKTETGTVESGALFTEELLPAETVLYSMLMASKIFIDSESREKSKTVEAAGSDEGKYLIETIAGKLNDMKYIQLGGDATIGKGLCRISAGVN